MSEPSQALDSQSGSAKVLRTRIGVMTYLAPRNSIITSESIAELVQAFEACIASREVQIVVNLAAAHLLSSRAIEALLDIEERLIQIGGWLKLAQVSAALQDVFDFTGLCNTITIMDRQLDAAGDAQLLENHQGKKMRLGDLLVAKDLIKKEQVEQAMRLQEKLGRRMGQIIVEKGWVSELDMLKVLGQQLSIPVVKLRMGLYDPDVVELLDKDVSRRLKVLPLYKVRGVLTLATADPQAIPSFDEVAERTNTRVQPVLARQEEILKTINEAYEDQGYIPELITEVDDDFAVVENMMPDDHTTIDEMAAGSPIINLINSVIQRAVHDGASDIHIEPSRTKSRIRYRIDGVLYEAMTPKIELHPALISRLKVMANLDIAERRMPQDGRIQVYTQGREVDLRFSSLPGLYGEKVVLRVLDKNQAILDVNKLGMEARNLAFYKHLLSRSHGLILVTGPTGSGKTTSLYAALNHLNSIEKNIVTIEDPVEYQIDIINQNEVKAGIGLSFAKILKHVLRQDPDIVMVGEIRERETAEIAVQAALTGHLVLSTLHTNDSVGAITRMIDMGVEPYLLSSALIGVVAQRLIRTNCSACKTSFLAPPEVVQRYGWDAQDNVRLYKGRGCNECYDSGYKGRLGSHEILTVEADLQRMIMANPSRDELTQYIKQHDIRTLFDDGIQRAKEGLTTIEEVQRVVNSH